MTEVIKRAVDAEVYAARWMRALGFYDAQETPASGDAGIDVMSAGAVAQVKMAAKQVGRPEVQSFVGAVHGHPD
ncbi:restriction endonuclease [Blastococcus sp. MG754426]|uniref:restriction endonuclease n=1 Tax=unclassified Blastococcus TaxID=2619396 RepID=UPI001EF04705|nr:MULTISPECIES: restriction endonuclease [unclassified Blastococcus]MCF6509819.1 restriction endonuclease [Blastococcus sp. MG754426]MCF6514205.1 restriction endonuclease [Blastococcus sp. MG754427]